MILALILAAAAATTGPAPVAPAAQAAASPADARKPEMVCRMETPLGTRFPKKVCRPKGSEAALGAEERKAIEGAQHGYSQCGLANNTRC